MTGTERMTWSEWNAVILNATAVEIWECGRALNNRGTLSVFVHKSRRYRTDRHVRTTAAELTADGWNKTSRRPAHV